MPSAAGREQNASAPSLVRAQRTPIDWERRQIWGFSLSGSCYGLTVVEREVRLLRTGDIDRDEPVRLFRAATRFGQLAGKGHLESSDAPSLQLLQSLARELFCPAEVADRLRRSYTQGKASNHTEPDLPFRDGVDARHALGELAAAVETCHWSGQTGMVDKRVLNVLIKIGTRVGSTSFKASQRRIAQEAAIHRATVGVALGRLAHDQWLELRAADRHDRGEAASRRRQPITSVRLLRPRSQITPVVRQPRTTRRTPTVSSWREVGPPHALDAATHDRWRAFGRAGAGAHELWCELRAAGQAGSSLAEIVEAGTPRATACRRLNLLEKARLAARDDCGRWHAVADDDPSLPPPEADLQALRHSLDRLHASKVGGDVDRWAHPQIANDPEITTTRLALLIAAGPDHDFVPRSRAAGRREEDQIRYVRDVLEACARAFSIVERAAEIASTGGDLDWLRAPRYATTLDDWRVFLFRLAGPAVQR